MKYFIKFFYPEYIDYILCSHNWMHILDKYKCHFSPLPEDSIHKMYAKVLGLSSGDPTEGTDNHLELHKEIGFFNCTLLGRSCLHMYLAILILHIL